MNISCIKLFEVKLYYSDLYLNFIEFLNWVCLVEHGSQEYVFELSNGVQSGVKKGLSSNPIDIEFTQSL